MTKNSIQRMGVSFQSSLRWSAQGTAWRVILLLMLAACCGVSGEVRAAAEPPPETAAALYRTDAIWTVTLTLTPEQWAAMEPKGGGNGFPGGPPGGPGGFGPAMFIAPAFLKQGDQDQDGKLSKEEFAALGQKWFDAWDKGKAGSLSGEQLRSGLNASFVPPPGAERPGGPPPGMMGNKFDYVHADLEFAGQKFENVAIRYKGNFTYQASRNQLKRSFKIDLNKYVKGQKLAGLTKLNLHSNVTDPVLMREPLSYRLYRDAGVPAPRTAYARVFVTVPGKHDHRYFGLYSLVEQVDKHFAEERFDTKKGLFFKPNTRDLFTDLGDDWAKYQSAYDPKDDPSKEEKQRLMGFSRFVSKADDAEFAAKLGDWMDIEEFAKFMSATVWLSTMDSILSMGHNYYIYLDPKTQKFAFLPWDLDLSFGKFNMAGGATEKLSIQKPWTGNNRFLERVFKVEEFKKRYVSHLEEYSKTIFQPERISRQVDELAAVIRPAVQEESREKLASFDKDVAGEPVEPARIDPAPGRRGGGGPGFGGPGGPGGPFQSAKPIKAFVKLRASAVLDQLAGKTADAMENGGGPGFGGPGGPGGFGPGMFLGPALMNDLDANKDGALTRDEFSQGLARWFEEWNTDHTGALTEAQLRAGISKDLAPFRNGPPGAPGGANFGPPPPGDFADPDGDDNDE